MMLYPTLPPNGVALLDWKLQLPVDRNGGLDPFDADGNRIPTLEVRNLPGYDCPFLYPSPEGPLRYYETRGDGALVLGAPVDGLRTQGALYARTELREMSGGANAAWTLAEGGALTVEMQVDAMPAYRSGGTAPIVIGQIASTMGDQLARLYYADGSVYWVNGDNEAASGDLALAIMDPQADRPDIDLGEGFAYQIEARDEALVLTVVADGVTYRSGLRIGPGWDDDAFFFKAGVYLGADQTTATGWGQVSITGLGLRHDLTAAPILPPSPLPAIDGAISDNGLAARLRGTTGDDIFVVSRTGTTVNAKAGFDTAYAIATWTMSGDVERLVLAGDRPIDAVGRLEASDVILGNAAANLLEGRGGGDRLDGESGDDTIRAGSDDDWLQGGAGSDRLDGGPGDDTLDGGTGSDTLEGGPGDDTYAVDGWIEAREAPGEGTDTVRSRIAIRLGDNLENLVLLGPDGLRGVGNALANTILGTDGGDTLVGGGGADVLRGGSGDDLYIVDAAGEAREAGAAGHDLVRSSVDYQLGAGIEDLALQGPAAVRGIGNELANRVAGTTAANTLDGRGGTDVLLGGKGDDVYLVDAQGEAREAPGAGTDTVRATVSYALGLSLERLALLGLDDLSGTGNGLANQILGNAGANTLDGRGGLDDLRGGEGDDLYLVDRPGEAVENLDSGADTVRSAVSYELGPNLENLELIGTGRADATGNRLGNVLTGNVGANRIAGEGGNDVLTGGGGSDLFVFDTRPDAQTNLDRIVDMNGAGDDRIALAAAVFRALTPGALPSAAFEANARGEADGAGDRIVYDTSTGDLLYDPDGSASGGTILLFARLAPGLALDANDFVVV